MNFNKVIMMGRLTRDPEMKYLGSGTPLLSASFVTNGRRKQGESWVDEPCFIDITCFGGLAERVAEKLQKGSQILIEGRLRQHKWDAQDGSKRSKHEIIVDNMRVLSTAHERESGGASGEGFIEDESDLPF